MKKAAIPDPAASLEAERKLLTQMDALNQRASEIATALAPTQSAPGQITPPPSVQHVNAAFDRRFAESQKRLHDGMVLREHVETMLNRLTRGEPPAEALISEAMGRAYELFPSDDAADKAAEDTEERLVDLLDYLTDRTLEIDGGLAAAKKATQGAFDALTKKWGEAAGGARALAEALQRKINDLRRLRIGKNRKHPELPKVADLFAKGRPMLAEPFDFKAEIDAILAGLDEIQKLGELNEAGEAGPDDDDFQIPDDEPKAPPPVPQAKRRR